MKRRMAPLESMSDDEAFLSLLSSQRELLNRLNMESNLRREQPPQSQPQSHPQGSGPIQHPPVNKRGSILGSIDPLSLMNTPIIERRGSLDMLFSRRLSMGMGLGGDLSIPNLYAGAMDDMKQKDYGGGYEEAVIRKMKRRRSSLGLLTDILNDDPHSKSRRFSMLSTFSRAFENDDLYAQDLTQPIDISSEPPTHSICFPDVNLDPSIGPEQMRCNLEAFAAAMERSTKSQQDIHDWDRKMGLKRSHSKTMRLSMRSRKKLRSLMKKDLGTLIAHQKSR